MRSILAILCCVAAHTCRAQQPASVPSDRLNAFMESGMEVSGIRAPYYDDETGELRAQLHGGNAKVQEGGVAEISYLRIDVFQKGAVVMTIYAPHCFARMAEAGGKQVLEVYSDGDVLIDLEQMTVAGRGFRFSSAQNRFEILHDAKVLVRDTADGLKGFTP